MNTLSVLGKKWEIAVQDTDLSLMERIYKAKGLETDADRHAFITADPRELLHDPFLLQ